jgi:hypothetical protein
MFSIPRDATLWRMYSVSWRTRYCTRCPEGKYVGYRAAYLHYYLSPLSLPQILFLLEAIISFHINPLHSLQP